MDLLSELGNEEYEELLQSFSSMNTGKKKSSAKKKRYVELLHQETLYLSLDNRDLAPSGERVNKRNLLIFLCTMLRKKIRVMDLESCTQFEIYEVTPKEKEFILRFIEDGCRINIEETDNN